MSTVKTPPNKGLVVRILDSKTVEVNGVKYPYMTTDAWTTGNPGPGGARVCYNGKVVKEFTSEEPGTNNLFELIGLRLAFEALVEKNVTKTVYVFTDSFTALSWIDKPPKAGKISPLVRDKVFAERDKINFLRDKAPKVVLLKWDTHNWGEIPADYGRK